FSILFSDPPSALPPFPTRRSSDLRFFFSIALPLSKPLIVLMAMIHIVANWNAFFDAMIYLSDESKYPLQLILRNVLIQSQASASDRKSTRLNSSHVSISYAVFCLK